MIHTITLALEGNTYQHRDALRAAGWKWNATYRHWEHAANSADVLAAADRVPGARQALAEKIGANKRECQLVEYRGGAFAPRLLWRSPAYAAWEAKAQARINEEY